MTFVLIIIVLVVIVFAAVIYLTNGMSVTSSQLSKELGSQIVTFLAIAITGGSALVIFYTIVKKH